MSDWDFGLYLKHLMWHQGEHSWKEILEILHSKQYQSQDMIVIVFSEDIGLKEIPIDSDIERMCAEIVSK
jgi:hypothetical protein